MYKKAIEGKKFYDNLIGKVNTVRFVDCLYWPRPRT